MIRPFTLLCFCAFAGAGAWLYGVKHAVAMKDRELVEIRRQTEQARSRIDILRAEWALLNEPERLRQTASRVLTLEPMQPQHFVRMTDVERRLPTAVAFAGAPDIFAAPPAPAGQRDPNVMLASAPVAAAARPAATPAAAPPAPVQGRAPEAPAPQALAAAVAQQRAEAAQRAALQAPPRPAPAAPQTAIAQVTAQPARPAPAPPRPVQPAVQVAPAQAEPVTRLTRSAAPETTVASALGGASSLGRPMLAPPVPISSASAATLDGYRAPAPYAAR